MFNFELAFMLVKVLTKRFVKFPLPLRNGPVLGHKILKGGENFGEVELFFFNHAATPSWVWSHALFINLFSHSLRRALASWWSDSMLNMARHAVSASSN